MEQQNCSNDRLLSWRYLFRSTTKTWSWCRKRMAEIMSAESWKFRPISREPHSRWKLFHIDGRQTWISFEKGDYVWLAVQRSIKLLIRPAGRPASRWCFGSSCFIKDLIIHGHEFPHRQCCVLCCRLPKGGATCYNYNFIQLFPRREIHSFYAYQIDHQLIIIFMMEVYQFWLLKNGRFTN